MSFVSALLLGSIFILIIIIAFLANQEPDRSQYVAIEEYENLKAIKIKLEQDLIVEKMQIDQQAQEIADLMRKKEEEVRKNREIGSRVTALTKTIDDLNNKISKYEEQIMNNGLSLVFTRDDITKLDNALSMYIEANPHEKNDANKIQKMFQAFDENLDASNDSIPSAQNSTNDQDQLSAIINVIRKSSNKH